MIRGLINPTVTGTETDEEERTSTRREPIASSHRAITEAISRLGSMGWAARLMTRVV